MAHNYSMKSSLNKNVFSVDLKQLMSLILRICDGNALRGPATPKAHPANPLWRVKGTSIASVDRRTAEFVIADADERCLEYRLGRFHLHI